LRLVVAGTAAETGGEFSRALVRNLAEVLGTRGAWVTEYLPEQGRLRALAMWLNGGFVEHYEYSIAGTVCADVVESRKLIHIPDRLIELFPRDEPLVPLGAVSYLGAPLLDTNGSVMGHLSVLDDKPMPRDERAIALFEIFAARAAAEQRRLKAEQAARAREEQMALLLESAMDAILVLDGRMQIVRVNPAAERLLGCTAEDLLGGEPQGFPGAGEPGAGGGVREGDRQPATGKAAVVGAARFCGAALGSFGVLG
jgi:GAF domain-containing protein